MKRSKGIISVFVMMLLIAVGLSGCSKQAGPTDVEAQKVIQAAVEGSLKGQTLKTPVAIVEKGVKLPSGEWPFKVSYTIANPDGSEKKEVASYNLSPMIDSMGANTWSALEAKK